MLESFWRTYFIHTRIYTLANATHRSLVLGIMVPNSLIRSLMLNLLLLSTVWEKRKGKLHLV